ncbi:MAG: hypothetical protein KGY61_06600 [Desulfobacterales bacterium]|nr:hypothetical protein [Desulfobacterales bacterium]
MAVAKKLKIMGLAIAGVLFLSFLGFGYFFVMPTANNEYPLDTARLSGEPADGGAVGNTEGWGPRRSLAGKYASKNIGKADAQSLEDRLVKELKERYGDTIFQKSTQTILLRVKKFLTDLYPEDGKKRFYKILKRAFPDQADRIIETLAKMEQYNRWLADNRHLLADMSSLERKGALWEKRRELFGPMAKKIWSEEVLAYEERKRDMRETISLLDESYDTTIEEKLDIYKSTLNQTYEDSPEEYILANKGMLAKVFFGIDAVQKQIKQMTPEERQWEINQIRRDFGYTEEQIQKMEAVDAERNRRWKNGRVYMKAREALVQKYEGPELEKRLQKLREKHFKHEAKTIRLEEEDGFFRYERQRVYGRN